MEGEFDITAARIIPRIQGKELPKLTSNALQVAWCNSSMGLCRSQLSRRKNIFWKDIRRSI